jgi:hypothetical protein
LSGVMAEHPELWTEKTPEPLPDRTPALGASLDLEPLAEEAPPPPPPQPRRERGPFLTYLFLPWSYGEGDRQPGEAWHRMKCRLRRHQMVGGQMVQVGGDVVFLERTCRWCGVGAEAG